MPALPIALPIGNLVFTGWSHLVWLSKGFRFVAGTELEPESFRFEACMDMDMNRHRVLVFATVALTATLWAYACGDGATEPPAPPPDPPRPTTVSVSPATAELAALGEIVQLTAEVRDQNGRAMGGAPVSWSSADTTVATVNSAGLATAAANGTTTITAMAGEASGESVVKVMQSASSVAVSPAAETVATGDTLRLVAEAFDENGHVVEDAEFAWSSGDVSIATVDDSGLLRGVAGGTATIAAMAGSARGTARITVANPDRATLEALYNATDGPNWVNNENWLTDAPLGEWYGVDTDTFGRVVRLDLSGSYDYDAQRSVTHGLTGPMPAELGNLGGLTFLSLRYNNLSGPIPPELGRLTELRSLDLSLNSHSGPIPAELGNLANLTDLYLYENALSGPIPPELGGLTELLYLNLSVNSLSGLIPQSFLQMDKLILFYIFDNENLCVPGTSPFVSWLREIEGRDEPENLCNAADAAALTSLYETTGGTAWTESAGWLGDGAVEEWYGVTTDSLGRVKELDLARNGLAGRLPGDLGDLAKMTVLRIGDNALSGRLPESLTKLSLSEFHYTDTALCVPTEMAFREWLGAIASHDGTGVDCVSLLEILEIFYEATDGPNWTNNDNWLTDAPLRDWNGVGADAEGRVVSLRLSENNLTGPIPPELSSLANLKKLNLDSNNLTGSIPPELGNLASLELLSFGSNHLTGSIPPELGNLANLGILSLPSNALKGSIPPELGNLVTLDYLSLRSNALKGSIPPELGNLFDLNVLSLRDNALTGPIPPELGNLSSLEIVFLNHNELEGQVPPELGGMSSLRELSLSHNEDLRGSLPTGLTSLRRLEALVAAGTGLCAPSDPVFQAWLEGVRTRRIASCIEGDPAAAHLTQAVQSREFPVPLVAGKKALLRVFPRANQATAAGIPAARARFFVDGRETHVVDIPGKSDPIRTEVDESSLSNSANAEIPAEVIQPGLEMVIEVDPNGKLDPALGVARRIPAMGRLAVDVHAMPRLDLTLIPFIWSETRDSSVVDLIRAMAADPENHELLWDTRSLLPVGEFGVTAHEPVLTSSNSAFTLLDETEAIRILEGRTGYYMGMMPSPVTGAAGVAKIAGRASFSRPLASTMAHELGHNLNLLHAPCGTNGYAAFPYSDGSIGAWGYDFRDGGRLVPPSTPDLMSYCRPRWISDFYFTNMLRFRLHDADSAGLPRAPVALASAKKSLLLWGGVRADSVPYLEPAFVVDAPAALPDSAGQYRLIGSTGAGAELFSFGFTMPETADGDGRSSFAFVLPVRAGWEGDLASITLDGPGGSATLDGESDIPMAILRNPRTGQIRGILRNLPPATRVAADAPGQAAGPGLEVLFSRGIPGFEAWRR